MPCKNHDEKTTQARSEVSFLKDTSTMQNRNIVSIILKSKTETVESLIRKATEALSSTKKFDEENQEVLEWIK